MLDPVRWFLIGEGKLRAIKTMRLGQCRLQSDCAKTVHLAGMGNAIERLIEVDQTRAIPNCTVRQPLIRIPRFQFTIS